MICDTLDEFVADFRQQIVAEAHVKDEERFTEDVFVERMIDFLHDAQELENAMVCNYKGYGMKVNGYDLSDENKAITILVAHHDSNEAESASKIIKKSDIDTAFKRATAFLVKSKGGYHEKLEESCEVYDLARIIHNSRGMKQARVILLANGIIGSQPARKEDVDGLEITYQIWDIGRLYRFVSSGMKKEPVVVDFTKEFGAPLECIQADDADGMYTAYLAIVPGEILGSLYDKWGTRVLERNVRAFLQTRGKVNRGIRDTIVGQPNMFLAYNNGITVTAESVEVEKLASGSLGIKKVTDFQIVNGGQTVASLWHTQTKKRTPLSSIAVQMKLTVLSDPARIKEITPFISRYSNTQNKVNTADFYANDPYHLSLEKISRSTWAPDPTGGGQQTKWFYERARGSYDETRNRERTPARIRTWDAINPRRQKFDKLTLGKVEKTWMLQPHMVSRGAQKNFVDFTIDLKEEGIKAVDQDYFKDIVARLIIWKSAEKVISRQGVPGYRANIVTYTLAWILFLIGNRIDLQGIWQRQTIGDGLHGAMDFLAHKVREHITNTDLNITEWCKKEMCWKKLQEKEISLPASLSGELLDTGILTRGIGSRKASEKDQKLIAWAVSLDTDVWKAIARWGSVTKSLEPWQNSISFSIAKRIARGKDPSVKQVWQGKKIYKKALKFGFKPETVSHNRN